MRFYLAEDLLPAKNLVLPQYLPLREGDFNDRPTCSVKL